MHTVSSARLVPVLGLLTALALAGCAGSSGTSASSPTSAPTTSGAPSGGSDPASLVPPEIKSAGVIRAATDATYPPNEFVGTDGKTLIGFDIELANAVASKLGVKIQFANAKFDSIITGITAGSEREVANTVVFIDGGVVVESGQPRQVIDAPREERTKAYLGKVL